MGYNLFGRSDIVPDQIRIRLVPEDAPFALTVVPIKVFDEVPEMLRRLVFYCSVNLSSARAGAADRGTAPEAQAREFADRQRLTGRSAADPNPANIAAA
jgi:hypothetical protein